MIVMTFINIGAAYIRGWTGGVWGWWQRLKHGSRMTQIVDLEFRVAII